MAAAWNWRKAFAGDALRLTFDRGSAAGPIWERLRGGTDRLRGHPAGCIFEGPQTGQHQHPRRNSQRSVSSECDTRKPPAQDRHCKYYEQGDCRHQELQSGVDVGHLERPFQRVRHLPVETKRTRCCILDLLLTQSQ